MRQTAGDFLGNASPASAYGLTVAPNGHESALPVTSHASKDQGANPFHPDSPVFWTIAFIGLTLVGIVGVSVGGRVGPVKAGFEAGKM